MFCSDIPTAPPLSVPDATALSGIAVTLDGGVLEVAGSLLDTAGFRRAWETTRVLCGESSMTDTSLPFDFDGDSECRCTFTATGVVESTSKTTKIADERASGADREDVIRSVWRIIGRYWRLAIVSRAPLQKMRFRKNLQFFSQT